MDIHAWHTRSSRRRPSRDRGRHRWSVCGSDEPTWGDYDADGLFRARDGIATRTSRGAWRSLVLEVEGGRMRIQVDGSEVARGVAIGAGDPWFGLLGFGGGVRFRNVDAVTGEVVGLLSGR